MSNLYDTAPYFVQIRDFERQLLRLALETTGTVEAAATVLGVSDLFFEQQAQRLGGVFHGSDPNEPPETIRIPLPSTPPVFATDPVEVFVRREVHDDFEEEVNTIPRRDVDQNDEEDEEPTEPAKPSLKKKRGSEKVQAPAEWYSTADMQTLLNTNRGIITSLFRASVFTAKTLAEIDPNAPTRGKSPLMFRRTEVDALIANPQKLKEVMAEARRSMTARKYQKQNPDQDIDQTLEQLDGEE